MTPYISTSGDTRELSTARTGGGTGEVATSLAKGQTMHPPRLRFLLRWLMIGVILVACVLGAAVAFAIEPSTAESVLTGWAALDCIPFTLLLGRKVPFWRAVRVSAKFIRLGLPVACLFGLLSSAMSGYVGLVGGFALMMLMIGWGSLLAAAFSPDEPATSQDSLDRLPCMSPDGSSETSRNAEVISEL
jgi:hypothetical protein